MTRSQAEFPFLGFLCTLASKMLLVIALLAVLATVGGSAPTDLQTALQTRTWLIDTASDLARFDFVGWQMQAIRQKIGAAFSRPEAGVSTEAQIELVYAYLERAQQLGRIEQELKGQLGRCNLPSVARYRCPVHLNQAQPARADLELARLRQQQQQHRPQVEAILQRQVQEELAAAGLGIRGVVFPPVLFTFAEPPKKLTVSPRARIATIHSRLLQADNDPVAIDEGEQAIKASTNLSAYISNIGGLGLYPAMVADRASLQWVLSTIAHEWVHNYLTLFPLGLRYGRSNDLTILNETVADIIGDEIGERLVQHYDLEILSHSKATPAPSTEPTLSPTPAAFDFRQEMRKTRLQVDALLARGFVEAAEFYMEARRREFVAEGHRLRVLNQAYFAFHGNYATGAAASSPIGPQLIRLRAESGSLARFLERVRWFRGPADLEKALEEGL